VPNAPRAPKISPKTRLLRTVRLRGTSILFRDIRRLGQVCYSWAAPGVDLERKHRGCQSVLGIDVSVRS
jgi:hypothetical protein